MTTLPPTPAYAYRYTLDRELAAGLTLPRCLLVIVGMNPSTADADKDDPTSRAWRYFGSRMGATHYRAVNLYAIRATDPGDLGRFHSAGVDVVGPSNDAYVQDAITCADLVWCAWGSPKSPRPPRIDNRIRIVSEAIQRARVRAVCLGFNADGNPKHALYLPHKSEFQPWPK